MTTSQEIAQCVSWFIETKSNIQTQKNYTTKYAKRALARQSIHNWHKQFMGTGTLLYKLRSERPRTSEEDIKRIRQSFNRSSTKCLRTASAYVKDVVYRTKVKDISDLKERITAAVETIDKELSRRTWTEIEYYLDGFRATNEAHIEIY